MKMRQVLYISVPFVKDLVVCHFVRYWDHLSLYGHMEHKETQNQSRSKVRDSEKDFGSRFAADLFCVSPHSVSSLHIYTFVVSRAFMAGAASQAGDADSSRAPGLTSGLQGSVNVHRGALLLVPQWRCISSFVFYIFVTLVPFAVWSW